MKLQKNRPRKNILRVTVSGINTINGMTGDLPKFTSSSNKGRLNRVLIAKLYNFTLKEVYKAYTNWQEIFRYEGSTLTFREYLDKLKEAGLTPSNVGCKIGTWSLARYGDEGPYTKENCRFIPTLDNLHEQIINGKNWLMQNNTPV